MLASATLRTAAASPERCSMRLLHCTAHLLPDNDCELYLLRIYVKIYPGNLVFGVKTQCSIGRSRLNWRQPHATTRCTQEWCSCSLYIRNSPQVHFTREIHTGMSSFPVHMCRFWRLGLPHAPSRFTADSVNSSTVSSLQVFLDGFMATGQYRMEFMLVIAVERTTQVRN